MSDKLPANNALNRYQDEIHAVHEGEKWMDAFAQQHGADRIDSFYGETPGGVVSAWKGRQLLGYYFVLRDDLNWSVLVKHDLTSVGMSLGQQFAAERKEVKLICPIGDHEYTGLSTSVDCPKHAKTVRQRRWCANKN